ncbi:PAS domain-containing protein [Actomonas aquatica]|uniref:histidine kinase n=1 Tax=Actomonas aquatica TaxID=2866162 RepID=A0ABZ1CAX5_9BACT|nr:PAS domain-containing protein [Opitutus sp. WL0086]WRQ88547.1 PAS domain-containing protein [Opitutus sp. WL0086]
MRPQPTAETKLRQRIVALEQLVSRLTEAAAASDHRDSSWIFAVQGSRDGVWDWNAVTNEVYFSHRWKEMLGYEEADIGSHVEEWSSRLHPDDVASVFADLNAHLNGETPYYENEHRLRCKDGTYRWILDRGKVVSWTEDGKALRVVGTHTEIHHRKEAELENLHLMAELKDALAHVKTLKGMIPICCCCKKVRDDKGYWGRVETYIRNHSDADITHTYCPQCARRAIADMPERV